MDAEDINNVVDIWYKSSIIAHDFIPKDYWKANRELMKTKYIPFSETYVAFIKNDLVGFISLLDNYLAALFVKADFQGRGIGKLLLNYVKRLRNKLQLKVYIKNNRSVEFYITNDFIITAESTDKETDES